MWIVTNIIYFQIYYQNQHEQTQCDILTNTLCVKVTQACNKNAQIRNEWGGMWVTSTTQEVKGSKGAGWLAGCVLGLPTFQGQKGLHQLS
jgi:hypothetical protein